MEGKQFKGTLGQALSTLLAVINHSHEAARTYLLVPKLKGGLGPRCPKAVCPPFKSSGLFVKSADKTAFFALSIVPVH